MLTQTFQKIPSMIRQIPTRYRIGLLAALLLVAVVTALYWPRTLYYGYQQQACVGELTVAPDLFKGTAEGYALSTKGGVAAGPVRLFATQFCVRPIAAPTPGEYRTHLSLFGLLPGRTVTVQVPAAPVASVAGLAKPLAVSKPINLPLSGRDEVFEYALHLGDKRAACESHATHLRCRVERVGLTQGVTYQATLERYFQAKPVSTVVRAAVTTLTATTVTASSITPNETVFTQPKELTLRFDKPIDQLRPRLERIEGARVTPVPLAVEVEKATATVTWDEALARQAQYRLTVDGVRAQDGSGLAAPYEVPFTTSGGPKVRTVSVGTSGVALGAQVTLTFDQPVSTTQGLGNGFVLTGGAVVTKRQGHQVTISLREAPRCGRVTLAVTDELLSEHGVGGGSAWSHQTRMACHTTSVIGASAQGRPIMAYTFGSGPAHVVYTGAIHGNEVSTRSLMLRWIDELEARADDIPAGIAVVVVPTLNPDGVAAGTRTNARNVDLNRNFATADWKKDITTVTNTPFPGGGGSTAMSEHETQAIAGLIGRLRPRLVVSYHSIGGVVAANQVGDSTAYARQYASLSGYGNVTGSNSTFEYAVSGTADDYYGQNLGIASLLIELGSHAYHQFERNQKAMWALLR